MQSDLRQAGEAVFSLVAQGYSWGIQITHEKRLRRNYDSFSSEGRNANVLKFAFHNGACFY